MLFWAELSIYIVFFFMTDDPLVIDGMDNSKTNIPRPLVKTKSNAGMFKLPTKVLGCIISSGLYPSNRKIQFYLNHE